MPWFLVSFFASAFIAWYLDIGDRIDAGDGWIIGTIGGIITGILIGYGVALATFVE